MSYRPALAYDDPRHLDAHHFLVEEAAIMDAHEWERWLDLVHPDIAYVMPVRVTTTADAGFDTLADMAHLDENRYSLGKRVARLRTGHAWTEDPPSRTRHVVTNVRTIDPGDAASDDELDVESTVVLFRSRGDVRPPEIVCAARQDTLRRVDGRWLLLKRRVVVDESVLRTQNLAILL